MSWQGGRLYRVLFPMPSSAATRARIACHFRRSPRPAEVLGLSVVPCSVRVMDGGTDSTAETPDPESARPDSGPSGEARETCGSATTEPMSRGAVAGARAAADAATVAEDAFLGEVFTRLHEVIGEVGEARWPARGPRLVAAAVRVLAREQARLDAAYLRLLHEVEGREDVVPRVRGGSSRAAAFARASLGLDPRRAGRDADAARLTAGNDSDLATVGGAYGAGEISRAHLDVAVGVHRRLHASVREQVMPVTDPVTGEVRDERCIRV